MRIHSRAGQTPRGAAVDAGSIVTTTRSPQRLAQDGATEPASFMERTRAATLETRPIRRAARFFHVFVYKRNCGVEATPEAWWLQHPLGH